MKLPSWQPTNSATECGAKLLHRRVFLGVPKPENFILTAEENKPDVEEDAGRDDWAVPKPG